jgi:hypothetical protein
MVRFVSRFRRSTRVAIALGVLLVSGQLWFLLGLYSAVEMLGGRSHPVVDLFAWSALVVTAAAAVILCVEAVGAVWRRLDRRSGG